MSRKFIGNIVTKNLRLKTDEHFNKCKSIDEAIPSIPTIIVGLESAKETIQDFSILKKCYNDCMLWWTFTKTERSVDFEKDIENFYNFCIENIINNILYYNINIIKLKYNKIKKIINNIKNKEKIFYYYIENDRFLYVQEASRPNNVYGFSLSTAAFYGIQPLKIIKLLENGENNIKIKNFSSIPFQIRNRIGYEVPNMMILFDYFNGK